MKLKNVVLLSASIGIGFIGLGYLISPQSMYGLYGIDLEIAKIRKKLAEKGLDKNTIIILMGDNGFFLGERQISGKWLMYDNSIRVPLIVYDPRVKQHTEITDMALNIDVPATGSFFTNLLGFTELNSTSPLIVAVLVFFVSTTTQVSFLCR